MAKREVKIGTCGFGRSKHEYLSLLSCVEIQHTFYKPPSVKTLEKWRAEMPPVFELTLKAWQFITHEAGSPTYRRLKRPLTEKEEREAGAFKSTSTVDEAWKITLESAQALNARTILFQCPAKFTQTREHIANLRKFFKRIDRGGMNCVWEPRGPWEDKVIKKICGEMDLWHCVDPFIRQTVTPDKCYFRLHGIGGWRYKYEDGEIEELALLVPRRGLSYVFFNNNEMLDDAIRFKKILGE